MSGDFPGGAGFLFLGVGGFDGGSEAGGGIPKPEATEKGIFVTAPASAGGEWVDLLGVASPQEDVVGHEAGFDHGDNFADGADPFFFSESLESFFGEVVVEDFATEVELSKIERDDRLVEDHGGTETCSESEIDHPPTGITTERLEGGIIDDLDGTVESFGEIEFDPTIAQVVRFEDDLTIDDLCRESE